MDPVRDCLVGRAPWSDSQSVEQTNLAGFPDWTLLPKAFRFWFHSLYTSGPTDRYAQKASPTTTTGGYLTQVLLQRHRNGFRLKPDTDPCTGAVCGPGTSLRFGSHRSNKQPLHRLLYYYYGPTRKTSVPQVSCNEATRTRPYSGRHFSKSSRNMGVFRSTTNRPPTPYPQPSLNGGSSSPPRPLRF